MNRSNGVVVRQNECNLNSLCGHRTLCTYDDFPSRKSVNLLPTESLRSRLRTALRRRLDQRVNQTQFGRVVR